MAHFKHFDQFVQTNEAILIYGSGDPFRMETKITKRDKITGKRDENSIEWPKFYAEAQSWLDDGIAVSVITSDFIPNSDELGFNKKTTDPKYQSEINGTWGDKSLPIFMKDHPGYAESEFDLIKVDESLKNRDGVWIQDKDGIEFCIHPSRIIEVQKGASVRDDIQTGLNCTIGGVKYLVEDYRKLDSETFMEKLKAAYASNLDPELATPKEIEQYVEDRLFKKYSNLGEFEDMEEGSMVGVITLKYPTDYNYDRKLYTLYEWKKMNVKLHESLNEGFFDKAMDKKTFDALVDSLLNNKSVMTVNKKEVKVVGIEHEDGSGKGFNIKVQDVKTKKTSSLYYKK